MVGVVVEFHLQRYRVLSHVVVPADLIEEEYMKGCPIASLVAVADVSVLFTALNMNSKPLLRKRVYYVARHGEILEVISVDLVDDVVKEFGR